MIGFRRSSIVLFFCAITGFPTAVLSTAEGQHAPPIHSVPFHPPVVHAPPVHITPLHVEPIHVAPIHSEPVHTSPAHSDGMSSHVIASHLPPAPRANPATLFHAAPSANSNTSIGMGSFSHHGSGGGGGGGRSGGTGGGGSGAGRGGSRIEAFNNAAAGRNVVHAGPVSTQFQAKLRGQVPAKWDPDFSASQRLGHKNVTAQGRTISDHAAQQMTTPPKGRARMTATEVDRVLDRGQIIKADRNHPDGPTLTLQNKTMAGRPKVAIDEATGRRIVTVIKKK